MHNIFCFTLFYRIVHDSLYTIGNNIKQKMCIYYFVIKRKKLFERPNTLRMRKINASNGYSLYS